MVLSPRNVLGCPLHKCKFFMCVHCALRCAMTIGLFFQWDFDINTLDPVPVVCSSVSAKVQLFEGGEFPVHAGLEAERAVPEVVPAALVQHHQVHQAGAHLEEEVERDVISCQVVHAHEPGVLPSELQHLHAPILSGLKQACLLKSTTGIHSIVLLLLSRKIPVDIHI